VRTKDEEQGRKEKSTDGAERMAGTPTLSTQREESGTHGNTFGKGWAEKRAGTPTLPTSREESGAHCNTFGKGCAPRSRLLLGWGGGGGLLEARGLPPGCIAELVTNRELASRRESANLWHIAVC
jgi:hypothetical protein